MGDLLCAEPDDRHALDRSRRPHTLWPNQYSILNMEGVIAWVHPLIGMWVPGYLASWFLSEVRLFLV